MIVRSSRFPCAMTYLLSLGESQDRQDRPVRRGRHLAVQLVGGRDEAGKHGHQPGATFWCERQVGQRAEALDGFPGDGVVALHGPPLPAGIGPPSRSEEHTSELQSRSDLVCRLLLEKKKK